VLLADLAALTRRRPRLTVWLIAIALGSALFFWWMGYGPTLDPTDLGWIYHDDPFTHVLGWEHYRSAPLAQYPITQNPLYGLELSSNVVFSDSIPIVAVVLRPLSALLPRPFQYLGLWILVSCVMQAYWSLRLVLLRTDRLRDAVIGSLVFLTTPVVLERFGGQTAVGSHWLVLWALWLYLEGRTRLAAWAGLLLLAVGVHAYLFVMVGAIWAAHLAACWIRRELGRRELVLAGATMLGVVAWMHVLGYFTIGKGAAAGAWRSNFDLLGFFTPAVGARQRWLPVIYNDPWDGNTYLGAGVIALLIASGAAWLVARRRGAVRPASGVRWVPLLVVVAGLALFAITDDVKLLGEQVVQLPFPHQLDRLYEMFRGAARMMWPAYYLILLGAVWLALRVWPARAVSAVLAAGVALQLYDVAPERAIKYTEVRLGGLIKPSADPIWNQIGAHYARIVSVPAKNRQPDWPTFAWFAAQHSMGTNIGYMSRIDPEAQAAANRRYIDAIATGAFDPRTAYYVPSPEVWDVARSTMGPQDLAVVADGYRLILPGARRWAAAPPAAPSTPPAWSHDWRLFNAPDHTGLLFSGWSWWESWGTWSIAPHATLVLPVPPNQDVRISFRWFCTPLQDRIRLRLGSQAFDVRFPGPDQEILSSFDIRTTSALLAVELDLPSAIVRPNNQRTVGIGLVGARVQRASERFDDEPPVIEPVLDAWTSFADKAPGRQFLQIGWSYGESWGTWSNAEEVTLALPVPADERLAITLRWVATAPAGQRQTGHVSFDDRTFEAAFPPADTVQEQTFEVTSRRRWIAVRIVVDRLNRVGGRALGVGLQAVRIHRLAPP
jgi:hypothetical protein